MGLCHARRITPELIDTFNPAVTILGGPTGFGGIVWVIRRMQAEIRDLRAGLRQFHGENARQHDSLTDRIDRLIDSCIDKSVRTIA